MAKRKKRSGLSGLDAIPKDIRAVATKDALQYQLAKQRLQEDLAAKQCPLALSSLVNSAFTAGVARAAAVAKGEPGGAEELYKDFDAQRQQFVTACFEGWTDEDTRKLKDLIGKK